LRVLATAGHVDHGKSTLVRALTGTDPDRLAEEKERGLTIDLGFAWTALPSGEEIAFVDVPGHVRLIKNMLAGVGAVDACLFVVDATEGWKPQSEEHLRILELLGVSHGVVALTKVASVDGERIELAVLELADRVAGTFLAGAPVVEVDAPAGVGLDPLVAALESLVAASPAALDRGRPRLWVDRSFAARGAGTVVTGTLAGGMLNVDDHVEVWPASAGARSGTRSAGPGFLSARIRGLQNHGRSIGSALPGSRLAINLAGVSHDQLRRGQAVVKGGHWFPARVVDASLSVLAGLDHAVGRRGAYAAYIGSGEFPVRLRLLGRRDALTPGSTGYVRLWLWERGEQSQPRTGLPLAPGDRYVLRDAGRWETVGGGEVLDVDPVRPLRSAQPSASPPAERAVPERVVAECVVAERVVAERVVAERVVAERVVAERGWVEADLLERLAGLPPGGALSLGLLVVGGRWVVDPGALKLAQAELRRSLETQTETSQGRGLPVANLDARARAVLATLPDVVITAGVATLVGAAAPPARSDLLDALSRAVLQPPDLTAGDMAEARELARRGLVVEVGGTWFTTAAVKAAAEELARLLGAHPEGVTVGQVRDALGITRKHAVPLLGYFDATGVTRRRGDVRIAGPRLPAGGA